MKATPTDVTKERLSDEFNSVIAETEQLLKSVATAGSDKAGALRADIERTLAAAGDRIAKMREDAMLQAGTAVKATDAYVKENPWRAVGIVAAVTALTGLLAGLLIARR